MGVVEAKIQTVEDIYRLIWTAIAHKRPVRAVYKSPSPTVLSSQIRWQSGRPTACAVLSIQWGKGERPGTSGFASELALRRTGEAFRSAGVGQSPIKSPFLKGWISRCMGFRQAFDVPAPPVKETATVETCVDVLSLTVNFR